jgi:LuxR family maltose regulon positive regulatory protein
VQRLLSHSGTATAEPHARQNCTRSNPLSERELDVLRLLATDLDGPEIASQLVVSPNTMRTHAKSIYTELGVNSRRAAVRDSCSSCWARRAAARPNHHINHHMW